MGSLGPTPLFGEVIDLAEVDSTNRYALDAGRPGLLVRARRQTAGRGRRGRQWFSPEGENLYLTFTVADVEERYPIIAGVAVREALAALAPGVPVGIKWPNDLVMDGRKVCGILCEARAGITAVGMGINVNQIRWPGDLERRAISLRQATGRVYDLDEVTSGVAASTTSWMEAFRVQGFGPVRQAFLGHGLLQGYEVFDDAGRPCTVEDITMDGHLVIRVNGERRTLISETISIGWQEAP